MIKLFFSSKNDIKSQSQRGQSDASVVIVGAHHRACVKQAFAYVSYSNISLLRGHWLCPQWQVGVFERWCSEAGKTDVWRYITYARAPTPTYSASRKW